MFTTPVPWLSTKLAHGNHLDLLVHLRRSIPRLHNICARHHSGDNNLDAATHPWAAVPNLKYKCNLCSDRP